MKKIIFSLLALVSLLFFLEAGLRIVGAIYFHFRFPDNNKAEESNNRFNILCLGDSFTIGLGAPKWYSYPAQLDRIINTRHVTSRRVFVYTQYRINSSTLLKHLEEDIIKYKPHLIIVMTGFNDNWCIEDRRDIFLIDTVFFRTIYNWVGGLKTYRLLSIAIENCKAAFEKIAINRNMPPVPIEDFKDSLAKELYEQGESLMKQGSFDLAFASYLKAEKIEPENAMLNFGISCIYFQQRHDYAMGRKYALSGLRYAKSALMVEHAFRLVYNFNAGFSDQNNNTLITEIQDTIKTCFEGKEREKALDNLRKLCFLSQNRYEIDRTLRSNLEDVLRIAGTKKVKVLLMQYPHLPFGSKVAEEVATALNNHFVNNHQLFQSHMRQLNLKEEDLFVKNDAHCNAKGYQLIAENIYDVLTKEKFIEN